MMYVDSHWWNPTVKRWAFGEDKAVSRKEIWSLNPTQCLKALPHECRTYKPLQTAMITTMMWLGICKIQLRKKRFFGGDTVTSRTNITLATLLTTCTSQHNKEDSCKCQFALTYIGLLWVNARCRATFFAWLSRTSDQIMLVAEMYLLIYSGLSMKRRKSKRWRW